MSDLDEALDILRWGAGQKEFSASLTPAQCGALLVVLGRFVTAEMDLIEDIIGAKPTTVPAARECQASAPGFRCNLPEGHAGRHFAVSVP